MEVAVPEYAKKEYQHSEDDNTDGEGEVRVDGPESLSTRDGGRDAVADLAEGVDEGEEEGSAGERRRR